MVISIAPLLKQQSPSRHFEHGFIELPGGKRWRPRHDQAALLRGLSTAKPVSPLRRFSAVNWGCHVVGY